MHDLSRIKSSWLTRPKSARIAVKNKSCVLLDDDRLTSRKRARVGPGEPWELNPKEEGGCRAEKGG